MESSGLLIFLPGVFHFFGGLALGRGLRDRNFTLLIWGIIMGDAPILFDWFFLIHLGNTLAGFIGPAVFVIAALVSYFILTAERMKIHEKSIGAILIGGVALIFGLLLAPYLLKQAFSPSLQTEIGPADYIFGSCLLILPFLVGVGFIWSGYQAIMKKQSYDEYTDEREMEIEESSDKRKGPKKTP